MCLIVRVQTPQQGAQTTLHLAVSDEVAGVTGKYFSDCRVRDIRMLENLQYLRFSLAPQS